MTVAIASCTTPLPPEVSWLEGNWRWTSSCCSVGGDPEVPTTPDELVLTIRGNGEFTIVEHGSITARSQFAVEETSQGFVLHLDARLRYSSTYQVEQRSETAMTLHSLECDDCYGAVAFTRLQ